MRRQIYRISDASECHNVDTGEAIPFLSYDGGDPYFPFHTILSTGADDATLEELVRLCDQDAENRNAHDFCGTHRLLGAVLYRQYGREAATATMREIAFLGGLHGMSGVCSGPDAYRELNVGEAGSDWDGTYGA